MENHKFIFIGGLHRSGTSILHDCLQEHPLISGFRETGVSHDEGQFLQTVYPPAKVYGGPGKFGFKAEAHLTEKCPSASSANGARLFSEWSRYWDTSKPILVEKSPPNLIKARLLQALFPNSCFIMLIRHPVAVSLATQKWKRHSTLYSLLKHWIYCHELFMSDAKHITNLMIIKYEDFIVEPQAFLDAIYSFVGIENYESSVKVQSDINRSYFTRWEKYHHGLIRNFYIDYLTAKFEDKVNRFGYSLLDLELVHDFLNSNRMVRRFLPGAQPHRT